MESQLPFPRGETFFGSTTPDSADANALALMGRVYEVIDKPVKSGRAATGRTIRLICLRNEAAVALESKRLAIFKAGKEGLAVDGYARLEDALCVAIDDEYGSNTVAVNDLFYAVLSGPCLVLTNLAADATNVIGVADFVSAATAVTSGSTTAGRIQLNALTGKTAADLAKANRNILGQAGTARTTGNTNSATLVYLNSSWY